MNTPDLIESLEPGQVFVFGSNASGRHGGGAAWTAFDEFGAVWGVGEGLRGQSYAIPTMSGLDDMREAVGRFLRFAFERAELTFLVTPIGTGIAGHSAGDVAPMFEGATENVILPKSFIK